MYPAAVDVYRHQSRKTIATPCSSHVQPLCFLLPMHPTRNLAATICTSAFYTFYISSAPVALNRNGFYLLGKVQCTLTVPLFILTFKKTITFFIFKLVFLLLFGIIDRKKRVKCRQLAFRKNIYDFIHLCKIIINDFIN